MRRGTALLALLVVFGGIAALPGRTRADGAADALGRFLDGLADSTDAAFGAATTEFDTTGLDSLAAGAWLHPPVLPRPRGRSRLFPLLGFHRAQGAIVGAGGRFGGPRAGVVDLRGAYATSARLGRYAFAGRRTLWAPGGPLRPFEAFEAGRIGGRTRLDLELRYARENRAFMPEHAEDDLGGLGALFGGEDAQSIYEARGGSAGLALWAGDWRLRGGVERVRETPLPIATRWSVLGEEDQVPPNTAADLDEATSPYADVAFLRRDWAFAGVLAARGGGGDRWRLRGALARSQRLGANFLLTTQVEAGAAAAAAPRQRRFELGGLRALPTLAYGRGGTDHLLFTRTEIVGAQDVLRAIGLPHPRWMVLVPSAFFDYGTAWDDPGGRDVVFSRPPTTSWRGAVGGGLAWRIGVPEPGVTMRLWMAWPVGPNAGEAQFTAGVERRFSLLGRL